MKKLIGPFILAVIIGVGMASYSYAALSRRVTRSRPKPRIRAMHRPLSKPSRRCRLGDANGEVQHRDWASPQGWPNSYLGG